MKNSNIASGKVIKVRITNALKDMAMSNCKAWPNNYNFVKVLRKFDLGHKAIWNICDMLITPDEMKADDIEPKKLIKDFDVKDKIKFVSNDSMKFINTINGLKNFIPVDIKIINSKCMMELKMN